MCLLHVSMGSGVKGQISVKMGLANDNLRDWELRDFHWTCGCADCSFGSLGEDVLLVELGGYAQPQGKAPVVSRW